MRHRTHTPLTLPIATDVGERVAVFRSGGFCDTELRSIDANEARLPQNVVLTKNLDIIRRLPLGFPDDRGERRLRSEGETVQVWQAATGAGQEATRIHARVSATPIIVIGHRNVLDDHLTELEELWPGAKRFVDAGKGLDSWFRHPVIVCSPRAELPEWRSSLRPALVVCDGAAAWNSPLRLAFPDAGHLLILDRRSQAAVQLSEDIRARNPETEPFAPEPPAGIEAWRIGELTVALPVDDDEDLF